MKVKLVNYSQSLVQLFTKLTLGYSVKVKLVKLFTMYTLVELLNVKLVIYSLSGLSRIYLKST